MNKLLLSLFTCSLAVATLVTSVEAAFEETVTAKGATFKVGKDNLKTGKTTKENTVLFFLEDLSKNSDTDNLTSEVEAITFENLNTSWKDKYLLKLYNNSDKKINISSKSKYIKDDDKLRYDIFAKVSEWDDKNNNGKLDDGEKEKVYAEDSILRWRNDSFKLGSIESKKVKGLVIEFDGRGLTEKSKEKSATYDFEFTTSEEEKE